MNSLGFHASYGMSIWGVVVGLAGGCMLLLSWPVIAPVVMSEDVIDPGGPHTPDPTWWFIVALISLEVGLLGLAYE